MKCSNARMAPSIPLGYVICRSPSVATFSEEPVGAETQVLQRDMSALDCRLNCSETDSIRFLTVPWDKAKGGNLRV